MQSLEGQKSGYGVEFAAGIRKNRALGDRDVTCRELWLDLVWQRHMLDTERYIDDCSRWAGHYLHRRLDSSGQAWIGYGLGEFVWTGPTNSIEGEDLESLTERVHCSLERKPVAAA